MLEWLDVAVIVKQNGTLTNISIWMNIIMNTNILKCVSANNIPAQLFTVFVLLQQCECFTHRVSFVLLVIKWVNTMKRIELPEVAAPVQSAVTSCWLTFIKVVNIWPEMSNQKQTPFSVHQCFIADILIFLYGQLEQGWSEHEGLFRCYFFLVLRGSHSITIHFMRGPVTF